jgi:acid phosphatase family membrane protein YuiD
VRALLSNATLWLPVTMALAVQLYKVIANWVRTGRLDWRVMTSAGGMPSSHSAAVTSLMTATGYQYGLDSAVFAIAFVLAIVVMYDARGVRQESGKQARVLNHLLDNFFSGHPISEEELQELVGHTTIQVVVGGVLGIFFTLAYFLFRDTA